jgi:3-dehydroquinate dehydratase-2
MQILCINGPNLNLLGKREPEIYGAMTLDDIAQKAAEKAAQLGHDITFFQSNHEGDIVEEIQEACALEEGEEQAVDAIIINAAAFTHTSIAIHDALKNFSGIIIELHISNPMAREAFRHISYVAPVATGIICGMGWKGYEYAVQAVHDLASS